MKVRDIMAKKIMTATPFTPVSIVAKVLIEKRISGLPVVDKSGKLVGIITEKDMLRILTEEGEGQGKIANDYMTTEIKSFSPDEDVKDLCAFFISNPIRRVPVLENNKLVGLVSRRDIIKILV